MSDDLRKQLLGTIYALDHAVSALDAARAAKPSEPTRDDAAFYEEADYHDEIVRLEKKIDARHDQMLSITGRLNNALMDETHVREIAREEAEKVVSYFGVPDGEAKVHFDQEAKAMREIALAVVNEVGAGVRVGQQIVKLEADVTDLFCKLDGAHASGLRERIEALDEGLAAATRNEMRLFERVAFLESKSTPTTAQNATGGPEYRGTGTERDLPPAGNQSGSSAPSPAQADSAIGALIERRNEETRRWNKAIKAAEARGYERGLRVALENLTGKLFVAAATIRALLSQREGGKEKI